MTDVSAADPPAEPAEDSATLAATSATTTAAAATATTTTDAPMNDVHERAAESRVSFAAELGAVASNWRSVRAEFGLSEQDIFRRSERTALLQVFPFFQLFFFFHFFFFFPRQTCDAHARERRR
jgi:uncharacterized protein YfiM (DUF2279 family)